MDVNYTSVKVIYDKILRLYKGEGWDMTTKGHD